MGFLVQLHASIIHEDAGRCSHPRPARRAASAELESELHKLRRKNLLMEVTLAISTSSAVAGLWFWQTVLGGFLWKLLGAFAAIFSIVKPMLGLAKQIQRKEEM